MTDFAKTVYKLTARIPRGMVSTYKEIACAIGNPEASRAVGNALNKNPYAPKVPCHRVIRSNGEIGGFANGAAAKISILEKEGIAIHNGWVDLRKYICKLGGKDK